MNVRTEREMEDEIVREGSVDMVRTTRTPVNTM